MEPREFASLVSDAHRILAALVAVDPGDLPAPLAARAVPTVAHLSRLADTLAALTTRRVEVSGVWAEAGARSGAAWVEQVTGDAGRVVRDRLRAARVAEEYPCFGPDLTAGRTSVAHLAAVSRVLHGPGSARARRRAAFPAYAEAVAAAAANTGPRDLRAILDRWAAAIDAEPHTDELSAYQGRYLTITELGGEALLDARMPLDDARWLSRQLDALLDAHHRDPTASPLDRPRGAVGIPPDDDTDPLAGASPRPVERTSRAALRLDALLHLAALAQANPQGMPIVDGAPAQVLVVTPLERLTAEPEREGRGSAPTGDPHADPPPPATLWNGRPVPISNEQARRHACGNAEIRRLILDPAGVATELGRSQRIVPRGLRLQVAVRDAVCRYPGCQVPATACQTHHLIHWADGGRTDLDSLTAICRHHHRWLHEGKVRVSGTADGALTFQRCGQSLGSSLPRPIHDPTLPGIG